MKLLLATLAVLLVIAIGADLFVKNIAEERAAEQIGQTLDLDPAPDVEFGGFPFILKAMSGNFGEIDVTSEDVTIEGVTLERVEVTMRDVEISLSRILAGDSDSVHTGGGEGLAVMSERSLRKALRREGVDATVQLNADGSVTIEDPRLPVAAKGTIELQGRRLVISGDDAPVEYAVELPRLIEGLTYEAMTVDGSAVSVTFSLSGGVFRAPN